MLIESFFFFFSYKFFDFASSFLEVNVTRYRKWRMDLYFWMLGFCF